MSERECIRCATIEKVNKNKKNFDIKLCSGCNKLKCHSNDLTNCYFRQCLVCNTDLCSDCSFSKVACSKACWAQWTK